MTDAPGDTDAMTSSDDDDERLTELSALLAIFPELAIDENDPFTATLSLPIAPSDPVPVAFGDASDNLPRDAQQPIRRLSYFPNVNIGITLPKGYPSERTPVLSLSTDPKWLPRETISALVKAGETMWEDIGHDQMLYLYIDHIQDAAYNIFGLLSGAEHLQLSKDLEIELLDHDQSAKQAEFDRQSYNCGVCLEPKRGSACHRLDSCGHIFCQKCLQDFYNNAITEGDIDSIKCLDPGCAKRRGDELVKSGKKRAGVALTPSELLRIPLEHETVRRYVTIRHKIDLENDKGTVYCPRNFCEGAARSKKHKKPVISPTFAYDEESDNEQAAADPADPEDPADRLRVCEDCSFAFCGRCLQTWHGEYVVCGPPRKANELTEEDKASLEYIKFHTTRCPTCGVPAQKTQGCNHMICQRCWTHFCYLCSAWLDEGNPYQHYNNGTTGCYQRLWELEGGDGDNVGLDYNGGPVVVMSDDEDDEADVHRGEADVHGGEANFFVHALPPPRRLGGRFARAAARRAAAEAEAAERAHQNQRAAWNRHIGAVDDIRQVQDEVP